ncbi:MAG TPA: S9 family peptidase [Gemmatimonadaceae bacterium]|nr:S9 family peptidase [Gemmatimonadaceae bacterium]
MTLFRTAVVFGCLSAGTLSAQSTKRAFQPADWYRLTTLSAPALSPDGNTVAFVVTTVREAENKRHQEVWVQSVSGGAARRVTAPAFESSAPRWSDDGNTLYFTSPRPGARSSLWAIRMNEGGEAFQPESAPPASAAPGSQPTDRSFTITSAANAPTPGAGGRGGRCGGRGDAPDSTTVPLNPNDPYARMLPMARPPQNSITKPLDPARFDGRHITDERYKSNDAGFIPSTGRGGRGGADSANAARPAQLFIQRGTAERVALTNANYSHRTPVVSPDGKWVVFSADPRLRSDSAVNKERDSVAKLPFSRARDEADRNDAELFVLNIAACEAKSAECRPRKIEYAGSESGMIWSPDSKQIAFIGRTNRFGSGRLFIAPGDGGRAQDVHGAWVYEPGNMEWWTDGSIRMQTSTGGATGLWKFDVASKRITPIVAGRRNVSGILYDKARTKLVYLATDQSHPVELFTSNIDGANERKLTDFNGKLNSEIAWADGERFTYKSVDNLEIEAWLMKPYGYVEGKKYPVVLYIHGGPHSAYGEGWFDEFQNLTGAGMFVLFTNPRGSSGTNGTFTNASRGDWGGKDYIDLMKAVDIVAKRVDIDSTRMGVTGGSYGGFMTAWVTTKTTRFKAAQADRMISDWTSWWGVSDAQGLTNNEFFGKPWENQAMYDSLSPIRHVKNVKTPTLIVQSEEDHRTPMATAEMWYMSLKVLNVPAEIVRYPRSTHELSRSGEPWLLVDRLGRLRQWFTHWLIDAPQATATPTSQQTPR